MKRKLLLTGASGFLGYHLLRIGTEYDIYGFYTRQHKPNPSATFLKCDITNYVELGNYMEDIEPDVVIHTAAIADANFCQMEKELSYAVNVEATKNIAGICSDYRIPLAFTSTDLVFDGLKGNYSEEDEKNPVSEYGNQKAIAEEEVLKIYPEATVFRLPLMFGHPQASTSNYLQKFITQLQNEEEVNLFTDEFRSVCGAKSISAGILQLIGHSGIIHLAGTERLSRYEFGLKAATAFQLPISLVQPCLQKEMKMAAPRPPDVSLNITKALNLGYNPLQVDEELKMIASGSYL